MITLALAAMFVVPVAGSAATKKADKPSVIVPATLLAQATANPDQKFDVIVQGRSSSDVGQAVTSQNGNTKKSFQSLSGVQASLTGKQILFLSKFGKYISSILPNSVVKTTAYQDSTMWMDSTDLTMLQNAVDPLTGLATGPAPQAPAIAIVDSGVQPRSDFGGRLVASVTICSLCTDNLPDGEGHGTMVAGVAAGNGLYPGGAQNAPIVSIRTANSDGQSRTSDVVAAADWILAHAKEYNIRVANFSLAGATNTSIRVDPLDRAVESLWLHGIVVVAAAGNHGAGAPVSMSYAPGNDPFVITVGALDQHLTSDPTDDSVPAWSAYGKTMDGFTKPDVAAPGRYMIAAAPMDGKIAQTVPDRVMAPGYMWMSGTSFAAPVVSAAAAQILARHPDWTPDKVKGALMLSANYLPFVTDNSAGVGEIDAAVAASLTDPPNPNEGLNQFLSSSGSGGDQSFDSASWAEYVKSHASWAQASWASASWASASWSAASWAAASWSESSFSASLDGLMASAASYSESTFTP